MSDQRDPPWKTRDVDRALMDAVLELSTTVKTLTDTVGQLCEAIHALVGTVSRLERRSQSGSEYPRVQ